MRFTMPFQSRGFTLVELLVVTAIIGFFASIVLVNVNTARAKARDVTKQSDLLYISLAIRSHYEIYGGMPSATFNSQGSCQTSNSNAYNEFMRHLVDEGFLTSIPKSPPGDEYCIYNYGPNNSIGVIVVTSLEAVPNTTTGIPPSCRPWSAGANWCSQSNSKEYCICNSYSQ